MRIPVLRGVIRRRLLVNFAVDPARIERLLPAPFRPKLHAGRAIAGICLIRLEEVRPAGLPAAAGISSENAAHRIAVEWEDARGERREGVFIPRRDTGSRLAAFAGGRLFPGEHHHARFDVADDGHSIELAARADDGSVALRVVGRTSDALPSRSVFRSLAEASAFFEGGSLGFSVTADAHRLDALRLRTTTWRVDALDVSEVSSSFFENPAAFPAGSACFDHALVMRDVEHEWIGEEDFLLPGCPTPRV
jgi:hypothetical protein